MGKRGSDTAEQYLWASSPSSLALLTLSEAVVWSGVLEPHLGGTGFVPAPAPRALCRRGRASTHLILPQLPLPPLQMKTRSPAHVLSKSGWKDQGPAYAWPKEGFKHRGALDTKDSCSHHLQTWTLGPWETLALKYA